MRIAIFFSCLALLAAACSSSSLQDYCAQGECIVDEIADELEACACKQDVQKALPRLKKKFLRLATVMMEARDFELRHPDGGRVALSDGRASDRLRGEMMRVYQMEGGRPLIETAEREALEKIDAYEQRQRKRMQTPQ